MNLYAPGVDVLSTILNGETSAWSGTSMACPHVAGVVARFQSSLDVAPTTAEVSIEHTLHPSSLYYVYNI